MNAALTVMTKELRETMRDRRSLLVVFLAPLLITPVTMLIIGLAAGARASADKAETLEAGVVNTAAMPGLPEALGQAANLRVRSLPSREAAEAAVRAQEVRAALVLAVNAADTLAAGKTAGVELLYDAANDKSRNASDRLRRALDTAKQRTVQQRLASHDLDASLLEPVNLTETNLATARRTGGAVLGMILPYIMIVWTVVGGMNAAFDFCAGEKERGTMETLLVSAASRRQIILGKLGAVWILSLVSALFSLAGLALSATGGIQLMKAAGQGDFQISYTSMATAMLLAVPLALMMSSLLLVISTFARNQKEAQAYVFPLTSMVIVLAMLSSILGQENGIWLAFVPVLNSALCMKQVLAGVFHIPFLVISMGVSLAYALLTLRLAVSMFDRETVLFRA